MAKRTILLLLSLSLLFIAACGKDNQVENSISTFEETSDEKLVDIPVDESAQTPIEDSEEMLEDDSLVISEEKSTETLEEELTEISIVEQAEAIEEDSTARPASEPAEVTIAEENVAAEPEADNYATPATAPTSTYHGGDGSDIVFTGTITLPYTNITVPTINQFNYYMLNIDGFGSEGANAFYQRFYEVFNVYQPQIDAIFQERGAIAEDLGHIIIDENGEHRVSLTYGLLKSGWDARGNAIHNWYDISIQKREPREGLPFNYYLLDINNPLKWTDESRAANNWPNIYGDAYMGAAYDALLYLLTIYTSTPEEVAQGVMDMIYGETLYDPWEWYAFGDCLIRFHYADYAEDVYQFNIVGNY